jgi:hypothetical protein
LGGNAANNVPAAPVIVSPLPDSTNNLSVPAVKDASLLAPTAQKRMHPLANMVVASRESMRSEGSPSQSQFSMASGSRLEMQK